MPAQSRPSSFPTTDELLEALPWGVLALDEARIIRQVNPQMSRWLGAAPAMLLGQPLAEAGLPATVHAALLQLCEPNASGSCEVLVPHTGAWLTFSVARRPGGWAIFAQDIPDRRQREAALLANEAQRNFTRQLGKTLRPKLEGTADAPAAASAPLLNAAPAEPLPTASEEKYRALFNSIDEGFAILELVLDEHGQAIDVVYQETNPAFMEHVGADLRGHRRSELFEGEQQDLLLSKYAEVASTGQPLHLEYCMHRLGDQWFQLTMTRIGGAGSRQLGVIFRNVTRRKRRELNLAFLANMNADFVPPLSAEQIMARVSEQLGTYLHLSRCHLAEVDTQTDRLVVTFDWQHPTEQFPPVLGAHPISQYLTVAGRQHFSTGLPLVLTGPEPHPLINTPPGVLAGMGFGSSVDIPLLIDGQWRFLLSVARAEPGPWRPDEVDLLQQLAARLHARLERAQDETALQQAHDQLADVLEHTHDAFYALDKDLRFRYVNHRAAQLWGRTPEELAGAVYCEAFPQVVGSETFARHRQVLHTRQSAHFETLSPILGIWIEVSIYPGQQGGISAFFRDISARRQAEERKAFLLQLSDALRTVADPVAIQETVTHLARQHFGADRCYYYEIEGDQAIIRRDASAEGLPPVVGAYRLADFALLQAAIEMGKPFLVYDVRSDASVDVNLRQLCEEMHILSHLSVPVIKSGQATGVLCLAQRTPREWSADDVALAADVADRTWAAVERARAEEALHNSEQRVRAVMENLPGGAVFVVDTSLRYQVAEGAALRQLGLLPSDFVGRNVREMAPAGLWPVHQQHYHQALTGQPFEYEHTQSGRSFVTRGGPLRNADGTVGAVLAVSYDITARKQAEAALQESEAKYRTLFDSIDEGHCIIEMLYDAEGRPCNWRYVEVNPAFEKNNGLANATGKTILELTPDIEPKWFNTYDRVARTGEALRFEEDSAALGRWFSLYAFRVGAPGSHLVAVLFTDITARKQAEDALRLSEARLSLALQAGRMGSFEWNSQGSRLNLSAMSEEVLGLHPDTVIANSEDFFALVHPDDRARHQIIFDEAGQTGSDFHSIYRIVRPRDGAVRWIEERGLGTREPATNNICLRGVHWDVTEPMRAQQQLAEFNARLEQRVVRRTRDLQASRDLLQSVLDTNLIAMSVMEAVREESGAIRDFRLQLVSGELARETNRTDLAGKLYGQEYPGIYESGIFELAVKTVETGQPHGMEYYYPFEGFNKWYACQFVKLGDGVVGTNLNITERKVAEQERLRNLRLLEQAEAVAGLGSWDYELATHTMRWSDGMYQLFGLPTGTAVTPANYLSRVLPDDRDRAEQLVHRLTTGAGDFEETLRLRVHGQVKTVRMKAVVIEDKQGQAVRVLGVDLDISELQRLEQDNLHLRLRQQQALFEAVQAAQEAERKRMADSLHNGIGQLLYATKLRLDRLHAPESGTAPAVVAARREAAQLLGEAIRQTRALSHELVPMVLAEFGLAAALKDICRNMSSPQLRLHCQLQLDEAAGPLNSSLQMALYRMAQELAQNIIKHAHGATSASLELETMPGWVLLRAHDDGPGLAGSPPAQAGLGLRSIRDRVALLGGQLEMGSLATGGAYVRIRLPLPLSPA